MSRRRRSRRSLAELLDAVLTLLAPQWARRRAIAREELRRVREPVRATRWRGYDGSLDDLRVTLHAQVPRPTVERCVVAEDDPRAEQRRAAREREQRRREQQTEPEPALPRDIPADAPMHFDRPPRFHMPAPPDDAMRRMQ